jgi:GDPmannose 4,6-dehydratase
LGLAEKVALGNLEARRDWGFAGDYVQAMWLMLQEKEPSDFVVGTGKTWSVREFCEQAFNVVGLNYADHVTQDPKFFRPAEVELLVADPARAAAKLGWQPKVCFPDLVKMMVEADVQRYKVMQRQ